MEYEARMTAVCEQHEMDGDVTMESSTAENHIAEATEDAEIVVKCADSVTLYVVAATSFVSHTDARGDAHAQAVEYAHLLFQELSTASPASTALDAGCGPSAQGCAPYVARESVCGRVQIDKAQTNTAAATSRRDCTGVLCSQTTQLYNHLRCRAMHDHRQLFRRVRLTLPAAQAPVDGDHCWLSTTERVDRAQLAQDAVDRINTSSAYEGDPSTQPAVSDDQDADDMTTTTGDYYGGSVVRMTATTHGSTVSDHAAGARTGPASSDAALVPLVYNMGRYLLIASSRPGTRAANLQGVWSLGQNPSWDSKYTTNINLQMNYWIADCGNLGECAQPLVELVCHVAAGPGAIVARKTYDIGSATDAQTTPTTTTSTTTTTTTISAAPVPKSSTPSTTTTTATTTSTTTTTHTATSSTTAVAGDGSEPWVLHQNTDVWLAAAPMDGPTWGTFTVGGAWLATHLWERYLHTLDRAWLARTAYPVMCGAVRFFLAFLVPHPQHTDWLVTAPSTSPENPPDAPGYERFFDEVTGMVYFTTIVAGASIDSQILHDLFGYYIAASECLDCDSELRTRVAEARSRLVPWAVGILCNTLVHATTLG